MTSFSHTESHDDSIVPLGFLFRPLQAAYRSQFSHNTRGTESSRPDSAIPMNSVSRSNYTATNPGSRPPFVPASSNPVYRQESMNYQQVPTAPTQDWQKNAPTGSTAPSHFPSYPKISKKTASQSRHEPHQPSRDNLGGNGMGGIDIQPPGMSREDGEKGTDCCDGFGGCLDGVQSALAEFCSDFGKCCGECCHDSDGKLEIPCCLPTD